MMKVLEQLHSCTVRQQNSELSTAIQRVQTMKWDKCARSNIMLQNWTNYPLNLVYVSSLVSRDTTNRFGRK